MNSWSLDHQHGEEFSKDVFDHLGVPMGFEEDFGSREFFLTADASSDSRKIGLLRTSRRFLVVILLPSTLYYWRIVFFVFRSLVSKWGFSLLS